MDELGKAARDRVTGFEGIITGLCVYLYGCRQLGITPTARDGDVKATQWFDDGRVEIIGEGIAASTVRGEAPGGPNRDAPR